MKSFNDISYGGVPFHGIALCKTPGDSQLYQDIVQIALQRRVDEGMPGAQTMLDDYKKAQKNRPSDKYAHAVGNNDPVYKDLYNFWKKYYKTLHPILQGVDPTLQIASLDPNISSATKKRIEEYLEKMQ